MKREKGSVDARKCYRYHFFGTAAVTIPKENVVVSASVANISFTGIGLYSPVSIGKGKRVKTKITFIDIAGKKQEDITEGWVDWESKFGNIYLIGIFLNDELNITKQPRLVKHLTDLINLYDWPHPYTNKRISIV